MAHDLISTDPTPSVANTCPKCGGKSHAMYSDDLLECAANHWKRNEDRALAAAKDGTTGEGDLYPRDDEVGESMLVKTLASSLKLSLATNDILEQQLAAAKAEIERLRGEGSALLSDISKRLERELARDAVLAQCEGVILKVQPYVPKHHDAVTYLIEKALSAISGLKEKG